MTTTVTPTRTPDEVTVLVTLHPYRGRMQLKNLNRNKPVERRGRNATILAFLVFLLYASARYLVYASMPIEDFADWAVRDTIMNGPRLLALVLAVTLGISTWGTARLGLHTRGAKPAALIFVLYFVLLWLPVFWLRTTPVNLGASALIVLTLSSFLVAGWEEILYRGVFVNAIADWKGSRAAVWGSSFLFTIMHIQAQPLSGWPSIFLCGMLFALMRVQGVGLPWLILSHAVFDSLVFIGATGESLVPDVITALFLFRALFVFSYYLTTKPHFEVRAADVPPMNAGLLTWKN